MPSFDFDPPQPLQPHRRVGRMVAQQWRQKHPLKALLVRALATLRPSRPQLTFHPLESCPQTSEEDLELLLMEWRSHWYRSLASTPQGRYQLELMDRAHDRWLDTQKQ